MRIHKALIAVLALLLLVLATQSCNSTGGAGVVASVQVYDAVNTAKPTALARWDGNTLCMWGGAALHYELFLSAEPNLPLYGPFQIKAGKVYTAQRKPLDVAWTTDIDAPLPYAAMVLFRPIEIESWGLTFEAPPLEE